MNKRYRLGEIEEAVSEMEELIDIEDDIAEIDDCLLYTSLSTTNFKAYKREYGTPEKIEDIYDSVSYTHLDVYKRQDLGTELSPITMLVMMESIQNRIVENGKRGKATWLYIDEFHVLLNSEYSAKYLQQLWKKGLGDY